MAILAKLLIFYPRSCFWTLNHYFPVNKIQCMYVYVYIKHSKVNNEDYEHCCTSLKLISSICLTLGSYEVKHNKEQCSILIFLLQSSLKSSTTIFNCFYIQQTINLIDQQVIKPKLTHKLGKLIYNFNMVSFKILTMVSVYKFILKFIWKDTDSKFLKQY